MPGFATSLTPYPGLANVSTGIHNFGTRLRPDERFIIHHHNGRCSQTVLIDTALGPVTPLLIPAPAATLRPIVGADVNGVVVGSFHAPSGNHRAAEGVLRAQIGQALTQYPVFILGGDANSDITKQAKAGSVQAFAPEGATHQGGGQLDGMVCSASVSGTPLANVGMSGSDHVGVQGKFSA